MLNLPSTLFESLAAAQTHGNVICPEILPCCLQLLLLLCLVVFLLCLPVRLLLTLCCGVKLHPPGQHPPGGNVDEDADEEVVINMPPETATPGEVMLAWKAVNLTAWVQPAVCTKS